MVSSAFIILVLLIFLLILIQANTLFFERHYPISVGWLLLIVIVALAMSAIAAYGSQASLDRVFVPVGVVLALPFAVVLIFKLGLRDNWAEPAGRLLRKPTTIDFPHERFTVRTSDGVDIKGYYIHRPPRDGHHLRSLVIIAHGGFRSKDLLIKALMAAWLSEDFDVIGFDFRGHGESGGEWTGDGRTVADLKAVVDFAKQKGYQKIGVYGRSMGGWTAILEAVDYHDVSAIVVAGMPPGFFSQVPEFQGRIKLLRYPGVSFLMRVLMGVRFKNFADVRSPLEEINRVGDIPLLILYNRIDPGAGVVGVPKSMLTAEEKAFLERNRELPFTGEEVWNRADPRTTKLHNLPGIAHVYSLQSTRKLFTEVQEWFKEYLD